MENLQCGMVGVSWSILSGVSWSDRKWLLSDQITPVSSTENAILVGSVDMLSENGCVYKNMSFSERKTME